MPDWLSHILIGLVVAELLNIDKKSLVVLGSLLPDFITKIYLFSFFFPMNDSLLFVTRLYHAPIMGLIIPALIVPLFKYDWKKTYVFIVLGFMLHVLADGLTGKRDNVGLLLYPFSHRYFSLNMFWSDQYWIIMISCAVIYVSIKLVKSRLRKK